MLFGIDLERGSLGTRTCSRRKFDVLVDIINYIRVISILNDLKCSLSNVCYIAKNNINKKEKHFKNEQRSRDAAAKKIAI